MTKITLSNYFLRADEIKRILDWYETAEHEGAIIEREDTEIVKRLNFMLNNPLPGITE